MKITFSEAASLLNSHMPAEIRSHVGGSLAAAHFLKTKAEEDAIAATGIDPHTKTRDDIHHSQWCDLEINSEDGSAYFEPDASLRFSILRWPAEDIQAAVDAYTLWLSKSLVSDQAIEAVFSEETQQWVRDHNSTEIVFKPVNLFPGGITWVDKNYKETTLQFAGQEYKLPPCKKALEWFQQKERGEDNSSPPIISEFRSEPVKPVTDAKATAWYQGHVADWLKKHPIIEGEKVAKPSRDHEADLAVQKFGLLENGQARLSKNRVIKLRSQFAPEQWKRGGRPKA